MEKGPQLRGYRRPKGTPLAGGFTMALVLNGGLFWDAGGGVRIPVIVNGQTV
jgi:hypothetical protein